MTTPFEHGVRLSALGTNQHAHIIHMLHNNTAQTEKLLALGVTPGAELTVLQTFPGVIFRCDETELAVEPDVAQSILVEPV